MFSFGKSKCETCPIAKTWNPYGESLKGQDFLVALAGNPNTGKSTLFNELTGLRQHTGNWPGKTVARAEGAFQYAEKRYRIVDLPGTYSLLSTSVDETIARDFILFSKPSATIIVADATSLERNLNLAIQIRQITGKAVLALNLMDEAVAHGIKIDVPGLEKDLGIPVVPMSARRGQGIDKLLEVLREICEGRQVGIPLGFPLEQELIRKQVTEVAQELKTLFPDLEATEWVALRLLGGDQSIRDALTAGQFGDAPTSEKVEEVPHE